MAGAEGSGPPRPLRLAELLASVSLATDLATGHVPGHALRTCAIATALAEAMGATASERRTTHRFALLRFLGCTADAAETAALVGGDERAFVAAMAPVVMGSPREQLTRYVRSVAPGRTPARRARLVAGAVADLRHGERSLPVHCEVASLLARRAGLGDDVVQALAHAYERWDGKGAPAGLAGDAIPLAVRVVVAAKDVDLAVGLGQDPRAWLRRRSGHGHDPAVVRAFERVGRDVLAALAGADEWEAALAAEPEPETIPAEALDPVLSAFSDFADLKSPWIRGHSRAVAALAEDAGRLAGRDAASCERLRRAGLLHDLGRVSVENGIWDKPGPLTTAEWERVRLHPYSTERILARCGPLSELVEPACSHHERLDGSGYHRALRHDAVSPEARIVAAADVYAALVADRPHRPALTADAAAEVLESEAGERLDADAVGCVLAAAGRREPPSPLRWPAGLTDREVEVLRLLARGRSNRQVAEELVISPKTVGRHVENLYAKIGVSSRAAAAVFAMEQRLLE